MLRQLGPIGEQVKPADKLSFLERGEIPKDFELVRMLRRNEASNALVCVTLKPEQTNSRTASESTNTNDKESSIFFECRCHRSTRVLSRLIYYTNRPKNWWVSKQSVAAVHRSSGDLFDRNCASRQAPALAAQAKAGLQIINPDEVKEYAEQWNWK
jgi:hypothetical protein